MSVPAVTEDQVQSPQTNADLAPKKIVITFDREGKLEMNIDLGPTCCFEPESKLLEAMKKQGVQTEKEKTFCKLPMNKLNDPVKG